MATLNRALAATEMYIGFPASRTRQVARRLAEAGVIPLGGPRRSPELDIEDFVSLLAAAAFDDGLAGSVEAARRASALTPGGAVLTDAPNSIPRSARHVLDILAEMALGDLESQQAVAAMQIEFVTSFPEIAIHDGVSIRRFREPGSDAAHWGQRGHRKSVSINGGAFVSAVRSLFS